MIFFPLKCYGQIFPQANCENEARRKKVEVKKKIEKKI